MAQTYTSLTLNSTDEIVLALLSQYPFEAFQEEEGKTIAYIESQLFDEATVQAATGLLTERGISFEIEEIKPRNWNEEWEQNFEPVDVDDFCTIRADFHPPAPSFQHTLLLQPKMAFGTGHHETTYMMIDRMRRLDWAGKSTFDYGCGTGILAILAKKLGAGPTLAIDIEEESFSNTLENAAKNQVQIDAVAQATLVDVHSDQQFDIILANINRNVLLDSSKQLAQLLGPKGNLLVSGVLLADGDLVTDRYIQDGFQLIHSEQRGEWLCLHFTK